MSLTRTTVYVDTEDLALIKEAARSRGIAEAEIIREGVHLAAMATRQWSEPFFDFQLDLGGPISREHIRETMAAEATSSAQDDAATA